jgi:hypothetical protein
MIFAVPGAAMAVVSIRRCAHRESVLILGDPGVGWLEIFIHPLVPALAARAEEGEEKKATGYD